ncbi:hypothetical protein CAPTEDRAFT_140091, partial [Capitella teleta]
DENAIRGNWTRQLDFTLSCIGYAVGLGNLWRFPYLCMRNGGGAFLIPYFIFLFICGLPLFFLELSIGQFSSLSPLSVWKMSPLFKGIGWGMIIVSTIVTVYYNIIITWVLYFLAKSFTNQLPWATCDNWWNTDFCFDRTQNASDFNLTALFNVSEETNLTALASNVLELSAGIHELGGIRWQLLLCLFAAWAIVFLCLCKGVKSSGKVVYLTATAPYLLLTMLLVRGLLLPGAIDGILFYLKPDFNQLLKFKVWGEACLQIFYSLGPAWGGLITMASYNKFNNNCLRDSVIVCCACSGTSFYAGFVIFSVIGYMAHETGLPVSQVITSGPGLAFIAYPEAITKLPISPLWAILFFVMLLFLGLDSQFGTLETVTSGFVDEFPKLLGKWKTTFTGFVCLIEFIIGLVLVTRGGMYIFQILDWYAAAFSVMVIGLLECLVLSWVYGLERLFYDIEMMLGNRPSFIWKVLWGFVTPFILITILVFSSFQMGAPTYGDYEYPSWAVGIGWAVAMCSIIPIPGYMILAICREEGPLLKRVRNLLKPEPDWGPGPANKRAVYKWNPACQIPMKLAPEEDFENCC